MTVARHQGKWRYDFWKFGIRHRKGGYKTKEAAQMAEADAKRNLNKTNSDFLKLSESRLNELKNKRSKKYFKENEKIIRLLVARWAKKKEVTRLDIEEYIDEVAQRGHFEANKHLRLIKALFNHGIDRDWFKDNPANKVKYYPVVKSPKYIPPQEDLIKVLTVAKPRDRFYLLVVIGTMARIGEINSLKWEDIHEDFLILRTRKSRNSDVSERIIPINELLGYVLGKVERKGEYVFASPKTGNAYDYRKGLMKRLCKKAGVREFTYHCLRHYGASKLASEGEAITDIQALLGHQNISTTNIYLQSLVPSRKKASSRLTP